MNELTLRINQNPGSIELNFDELEAQLDNKLAEYKGAVFTEDSKTYAKKEVANLRKLKKDIDDARKTVKKKWMEPYDSFDDRMKKLMKKVDEPINLINEQVEEFEKKRVEKKRAEIKKAFDEFVSEIPNYQEYISLEQGCMCRNACHITHQAHCHLNLIRQNTFIISLLLYIIMCRSLLK